METFLKFCISFRIFGRKPIIFQTNSEAMAELHFYPSYLMSYINGFVSMSSTNLWNFFQILNSLLNFWLKTDNFSNEYQCVNIDQRAMCYILIDLSWQTLQTDGILFQILHSFLNYWPKTEKYSTHNKVGFMQARWGRHLCWSACILIGI